jgi:septal ring factor EnvC (AmiA/AmiB activator)
MLNVSCTIQTKKLKQGKYMGNVVIPNQTIYNEKKEVLVDVVNAPARVRAPELTDDQLQFLRQEMKEIEKLRKENEDLDKSFNTQFQKIKIASKKFDNDVLETQKKLEDLNKYLRESVDRLKEQDEKLSKDIEKLENQFLMKLASRIENLFEKILAILKTLPNHSHISINNRVKAFIV